MKKKLFGLVIFSGMLLFAKGNNFNNTEIEKNKILTDTTELPICIQKLNSPGVKGIRSFRGARTFIKIYTTKRGQRLYAFRTEASIGCNRNEPAGTTYYNDSCKSVAWFINKFSIKQGFKPHIAAPYLHSDFEESTKGDYPAYFEQLEKTAKETVRDPFPKEKSFTIGKVENAFLDFQKGDLIRIHTKSGLWHYRNKKLLNNYKIVPQLTTITIQPQCKVAPCPAFDQKTLVYFVNAAERFVNVQNSYFLISKNTQKDATTPTKSINIEWIRSFELIDL